MRIGIVSLIVMVAGCSSALAQAPAAAPAPASSQPAGNFPFMRVDARAKTIEVECEALRRGNPLEFFLCLTGTSEHEAVLRSKVKPSHLHAGLLMLGLQPGAPVHYSEAAKKWIPPHGPPLQMSVRFQREGKEVELPAYRLMRDVKTKREMQPLTWIFAGSGLLDNGQYAADRTGYLITVVNFEATVIDIPKLASNANELLMWETNEPLMPAVNTPVTLVIRPAGAVEAPATRSAVGPIDQPLIEIDASGNVKLDDVPVESIDAVIQKLQKREGAGKRVRVAVANSIEENEAARGVINALSRAEIPFLTIPQATGAATTRPTPSPAGSDADIEAMRQRWERFVTPHSNAVRDAAKTHYEVMRQLRGEQQRHIDEADKIQRLIDELEQKYQALTTPQPAQ